MPGGADRRNVLLCAEPGSVNARVAVSTVTLLSRGVAQVIEQGLVLFCSTGRLGWLSCRRNGRVVFLACSWVRS